MLSRNSTWTRFFTKTYWRFVLAAWWAGRPGLNVVEVFEFELPAKLPNLDAETLPPQGLIARDQ